MLKEMQLHDTIAADWTKVIMQHKKAETKSF